MKVYIYDACSTCKKALKFLKAHGLSFESIPIVTQPPSPKELAFVLAKTKERGGTFKNLFNTSGVQYRELKIADKIKAGLSEKEALKLLAANGKLIKRPFVLTDQEGAVGFRDDEWKALFLTR